MTPRYFQTCLPGVNSCLHEYSNMPTLQVRQMAGAKKTQSTEANVARCMLCYAHHNHHLVRYRPS